jgi:hypothetical protein
MFVWFRMVTIFDLMVAYFSFFFVICRSVVHSSESSESFSHQQMHYLLILENSKIYIKSLIKIAAACFDPWPSSESLQLSLAKFTLMLKQLVKLCHYVCSDCFVSRFWTALLFALFHIWISWL